MNKKYKDILSTFINLFWRLISGPLLLLFIPLFLTEVQQGYWYLFGSIAALSTFADLGFSNIILQFSAHEFAFLKLSSDGLIEGEKNNIDKLGSFFRFVLKWISTMCGIAFPIIFVVGLFFFIRDGVFSIYFAPWILYSIGSLINFFNNSILSFIEGMDNVHKIQNSRFFVGIINTCVIIISLSLRFNIYSLALGMLLSSSFMFITIFKTFGKVLKQLFFSSKGFIYPWKKEIMPLFKKYVLSFVSGYFLFQIYTPLMHYFHGPIYSGKVGITMSLVLAMFNFSNIWVYTITPKINILIEKKEWKQLDKLFNYRLFLSIISYIIIFVLFLIFIGLFGRIDLISHLLSRFLPIRGIFILIMCYFFQLFINSWAVYQRGNKIEPYWLTGIISAIWVMIFTCLIGKYLNPDFFFAGLLSSYLWGFPVSYVIYKRNKVKWHHEL